MWEGFVSKIPPPSSTLLNTPKTDNNTTISRSTLYSRIKTELIVVGIILLPASLIAGLAMASG